MVELRWKGHRFILEGPSPGGSGSGEDGLSSRFIGGSVVMTHSGYTAGDIADKQLILELGAYVGFSGVSFSRVSPYTFITSSFSFGEELADMKHLFEAHPDSKYPAEWSETDETGTRAGYVSLEKSEVYAKTAQGAFDLAGLGKVVKVSTLLVVLCPTRLERREVKTDGTFTDYSSLLALQPPTSETYEKPSICLNHFNSIWSFWII